MSVKFSNNATTELASSIGTSDTSITVVDGSKFPILTAGDYTYVTLDTDTASPTREIVRVTAISGNVLTVTRGQDGTSPASFAAGTKVELRLTAALLNDVAGANPSGEPIGFPDKSQTTITFDSGIRTFSITPTGASFDVYCKGVKYTYTTVQLVTIPNTTGLHFIYFSASGVLSTQMSYFTWAEHAPTAYVYWNATTQQAVYFGDERHGITLDWQTHEYLHRTRGAAIANGFLASGYTLNSSATDAATQIAIESGTFFDEDMKIDIVSTATPTAGTFQQNLLFPAKIPVLHLQGTSWVMDAPTDFPFKQGTSRPQYNSVSGGVWSTADVGNNQHATTWILATNNLTYPVIAIIGQSATDNLGEAEAFSFADLTLPGFPSVEFRPLYKLIYKASDGYANSVNARLESIVDLRSISAVGAAANPATDHGNLSGLSDDDHPQYVHTSEVRTPSAAVKNSFFPSQVGQTGKYLSTDGTNTVWEPAPSGSLSFTGDVTGSGSTGSSVAMTLAASGVVAGQYTKVTVDSKGLVTAGTGVTSADVTSALGYTPYNATNPAGYTTNVGTVTSVSGTGTVSGLTLTGSVTSSGSLTLGGTLSLTSGQVTTALGFTPYNATNPSGYITGITSGMVTTALGFTPYNATNPSGYITGITSGMVTTALGYTPYNATNPSGYITSSYNGFMLRGAAVQSNPNTNFVSSAYRFDPNANNPTNTYYAVLTYGNESNVVGQLATHFSDGTTYTRAYNSGWSAWRTQLDSINYTSYSPSLTGSGASGTWGINVTGSANTASSLNFGGGYTVQMGDWGLRNTTPSGWIQFGPANASHAHIYTDRSNFYFNADLYTSGYLQLHTNNYSSYALPLSGGTLTGAIYVGTTGSGSATRALRVGPSGGSPASFGSYSGSWRSTIEIWDNAATRMLHLTPPDGTNYNWSSIKSTDAGLRIDVGGSGGTNAIDIGTNGVANFPQGLQQGGNQVLHAGNYTGFNGILRALGAGDGMDFNTSNYNSMYYGYIENSANKPTSYSYPYGTILTFDPGVGTAGRAQFYISHAGNDLTFRGGWGGNGSWQAWNKVLTNQNYTSYSPSLTGSGASGTWGISITGNAATAYGLDVHTGRNSDANKVVRTDGNGYIQAGWINTVSGNLGSGSRLNRVWCSDDQYMRYLSLAEFKMQMGLSAKNTFQRHVDYTSDSNYWVGSFGGSGMGANETFHGGSGFIDLWSGTNFPPSTSHVMGFNALHYTTSSFGSTGGTAYGIQVVGQYDQGGLLFSRACSGGSFSAWRRQLDDNNYSSYALPLSGGTIAGNGVIDFGPNSSWSATLRVGGNGHGGSGRASVVTTNGNLHLDGGGAGTGLYLNYYVNGPIYATSSTHNVIHAGNYTSYSPSLTGSGASGTWGISISGSAAQLNGYSSAENGASVVLRTASNGYLYLNNWINVASSGLFSGVNSAHFYPSNASYGAWRMDGSNNGWGGIAFGNGSTGIVNLMTASDSNNTGFHNQSYGWQFQWANGVFYIAKNAYGGNMATALDSSNYTSYAPSYSSGGTFTGLWYFRSNRNTSSDSPPLQAFSNDGGGAIMSFHRGGYYAVNMGLDSDNVFRIGGWSAANNRLQMDMSGNLTMAGLIRAGNNVYTDQNYGHGHVGLYSAYRYQGVFFMGDDYKMSADGTSLANMYGMAWSHPYTGGAAGNLTDHGLLIINNGSFRCAISNSIVASGNITAYSDERLKKNWRDMPDNFVERLSQVRVGRYERIDDGMQQVGVSAQSLQPLLPEAIQVSNDEIKTLSVSYGNAALAAAVELAKELVMLKRELAEIKSRLH